MSNSPRANPTQTMPTNDEIEISAVVPVYRGAKTIEELCRRLVSCFEVAGRSFEIILVDDGSKDESWEVIQRVASKEPRVLGIRLTRNFGQHNATLCGFRHARGELIATLDEDLQNPPEQIERMIQTLREKDADLVYGIPEKRKHSWWRRLGSRMIMLVPRMVMKIDFDIAAFRLVKASIAKEVAKADRHDIIIDIYFAWLTERIVAREVKHDKDQDDRHSSYTMWKLIRVLFNMLCNYTILPLRMASIMGAVLSVISIGLACFFIGVKLIQGIEVPGFTAIIVSVLFSTGLILLGIGVMSEYLARTFLHVNQKPQSAVRLTTRNSNSPNSSETQNNIHTSNKGAARDPAVAASTRELTDAAR